ncbi:TSUP family transporter [Aquibacillus koreensis]|uniref:Probable membrane transporter protein n=1 Tax=Aquibacillus koreensis TaxID=279446 RepID=A0A9X3WHD3_9BACI|nr:TSUP family transporter [Aquibacillus koreensis]MCT2537065.1 TSUP family transporter [Aquibacillus koreensis]MDC3419952.1 TSUP family transporter [Aquibacillus koreensis]
MVTAKNIKTAGMVHIFILYFFIGLFASTLGAVAGLGGGVMIKPVLDLFGHFDLATIGVLSAATVLSMATVSLLNIRKTNVKINKVVSSIIAAGSILGGIVGKVIFNFVAISLNIPTITAIIQSVMLAVLLSFIYIYFKMKHKLKTFKLLNKLVIFLVGFLLGVLAAFLGIGGGPLNVAVLILLFSMDAKNAGINSIFIILFSQLSALLLITFSTGFGDYDLSMLIFMIPGGILGGIIGSTLLKKLTILQVEKTFNIAILFIIGITIYNVINIGFLH